MLLDFHSHMDSSLSVLCTDTPETIPGQKAIVRCMGLLPDKWTRDLEARLLRELAKDEDLHLGEVGLDRRFESAMPMPSQIEALRREIRFATELGRCISLHCVRETGTMLEILSDLSFRPFGILWHGFTGSVETARQLHKAYVMVSIGPRFKGDVKDLFQANPMTVLETDYTGTDQAEHDSILQSHYLNVSSALGIEIKALEERCLSALREFCPKAVKALH